MKLRLRTMAGLMALALLLTACGSQPAQQPAPTPAPAPAPETKAPEPAKPPAEVDRPLRIAGSSLRFSKMNPLYILTDGQLQFYPYMWMGLGRQTEDGSMKPFLAKSVTLASDCSSVAIDLHKEATWSDGKPITTADVEFTYRLANHPKLSDPAVSVWVKSGTDGIKGAKDFKAGNATSIEGIKIIDAQKMEMALEPKDCLWDQGMHMLVNGIQPKHILEPLWDQLDTHEYMDKPVVTSGPYKLTRFELDQFAELERVEDWWGNSIHQKPGIKKYVVVQFTSGATPRHAQLEAKELHVGGVDGAELERFSKMAHLDIMRQASVGTSMLIPNHRKPYMTKEALQAIAHAIDWDGVRNVVQFGLGKAVATPIFGPDWAVDPSLKPYDYNPTKARELLAKTNWDPATKLVYMTTSAEDKLPEFIQQNLKDVGVQMEIIVVSTQQRADRWTKGEYDLSASGGGVLGLDPSVVCTYFTPTTTHTVWTGWKNQNFYDLCAQVVSTRDQAQRQKISFDMQKILYDELPWINYGRQESVFAVDKRLGGFKPNVVATNRSAITLLDWYWKE